MLNTASLDSLPPELLPIIFRWFSPQDIDTLVRSDLKYLRLTCRTVSVCATVLFFRDYSTILYMNKDGTAFSESRSCRLFKTAPALSKLVRSVHFVVALAKFEDLRESTETWTPECVKNRVMVSSEAREQLDRDPILHEASHVYYDTYIKETQHLSRYCNPELARLQTELSERLIIFPNLDNVILARTRCRSTPLYSEVLNFWSR